MKLFLLLLIYSGAVFSETHLIWDTNKDHSSLRFEVSYLSFSKIDGHFKKFWGRIYFEEDGELPRKIDLSIDTSSVDTGSRIRDGHLRSEDFFASKKFPTIRFQSEKILAGKPNQFLVKGFLLLRERRVSHEVLISFSPLIKDSWDYTNRFVSFKTSLSRKLLGLDWNRSIKGNRLLVGDIVELSGSLQVQPLNNLTPPSKHMIPDLNKVYSADNKQLETMDKKINILLKKDISLRPQKEVIQESPPVRTKKNYSYILALIILVQLSYLGLQNLSALVSKRPSLIPYKTLINLIVALSAIGASVYLASFTL